MDCSLEIIWAAQHHGLTIYQVSAWSNVNCRSYPETKSLQTDWQGDAWTDGWHMFKEIFSAYIQRDLFSICPKRLFQHMFEETVSAYVRRDLFAQSSWNDNEHDTHKLQVRAVLSEKSAFECANHADSDHPVHVHSTIRPLLSIHIFCSTCIQWL